MDALQDGAGVKIMSDPGTDNVVVGIMNEGAAFEIGEISGSWCHIKTGDLVGWVPRDCVPCRHKKDVVSNGKSIMLDAGHSGYTNQSPVVPSYWESRMNWKLQAMLKEELEDYGFNVSTTRGDIDANPGCYDRGYSSLGYDFFISLHSNANDAESVDYPVVLTQVSGVVDNIGLKLAHLVQRVMGTIQEGRIWARLGDNNKDYYGVLRGAAAAGTPGVLIEHSFHTNVRSTNWLLDDFNLRKMAQAEAKLMNEYFSKEE